MFLPTNAFSNTVRHEHQERAVRGLVLLAGSEGPQLCLHVLERDHAINFGLGDP